MKLYKWNGPEEPLSDNYSVSYLHINWWRAVETLSARGIVRIIHYRQPLRAFHIGWNLEAFRSEVKGWNVTVELNKVAERKMNSANAQIELMLMIIHHVLDFIEGTAEELAHVN
ncbi:MAG: hypothetical protein NUV82_03550, partial [Candidatus Komeilibacteria bacterium]|nr:hypothetical protein [Candidatus Komeilibacteria bacterium]